MVVATAEQFPLPPPPKVFQSEENLKTYPYEEKISSALSGEERQTQNQRKGKMKLCKIAFLE